MLWPLTIVSLPTATDKERASVLRAIFFAALAYTQFIPTVYDAAGPLLGRNNHVGLLLILTIIAGFWHFHTATILAAFTDQARRRHHLMRRRLASAVASTCVVARFSVRQGPAANQKQPLVYDDQRCM